MKFQKIFAGACVAALCVSATSAFAQAAAPAAPSKVTHGPALSGVCLINQGAAVEATNAMQGISRKIAGEFQTEGQQLQTELAAYNGKPVAQLPETLRKRADDFQNRLRARQANLQPAERQTAERVYNEAGPTIAEVYQQRRCSVLIDSAAVIAGNPAMDITKAVIDRLNQKVPAPAVAASAPAAAAPAAATPTRR
ncbi:MAG: OmpH family outer membrane protein [Phenylobacterium sp.]